MIGTFRKFSSSIYAKILLGIIVIPFVFWGMGNTFFSGNKNVIVSIDKEKYSIEEFTRFIQKFSESGQKITNERIERLLSEFIGEKLIEKEIEKFGIKLSDSSLSEIIKYQKDFKRGNKFSRTEYEKFLIKNNITAVTFENNLSFHEKKKQLREIIAGGILSPEFLVNNTYDQFNQKRKIEIINFNNLFKTDKEFSENEIKSYYDKNIDKFEKIYKTNRYIELSPEILTGNNEFSNLFFEKIDEIDDSIIEGKNMNHFIEKFNLEKINFLTIDINGKDKDNKISETFSEELLNRIYNITEEEPVILAEYENKYFIIELEETENFQKKIDDISVRNEITLRLKADTNRKSISDIISKVNNNSFKKTDFDKLAKEKNVIPKLVKLESVDDNKTLEKGLIEQIYSHPEKNVIVVHDINFTKNYLIYIDQVENVSIQRESKEYEKYLNLSKMKIRNELYNTYDFYLKNKYKIDINFKALDSVKNYFIY